MFSHRFLKKYYFFVSFLLPNDKKGFTDGTNCKLKMHVVTMIWPNDLRYFFTRALGSAFGQHCGEF